jgi:hypothetical protein
MKSFSRCSPIRKNSPLIAMLCQKNSEYMEILTRCTHVACFTSTGDSDVLVVEIHRYSRVQELGEGHKI